MKPSIYIALDFTTWKETDEFIQMHQLQGLPVKVGMELYYREGPRVIEKLKANNHPIFLDLKLHDIPSTVRKAMKNLATLDIDILNVHALGGRKMMEQAKEGILSGSSGYQKETKLIAVTILTSMNQKEMNLELSLTGSILANTVQLSKLAKESGMDGVVCSVHEAPQIKQACTPSFLTVTPGIRLEESNRHDQERIATPRIARQNSSDILVVGRSITEAKSPYHAYEQINKEWEDK
ncbi:orotidine-5'-phosphate decarboxylase [Oceanobacillus halotolerans]|uniref:orotidine-5'-phosphate decarboxylase n=1 Tax=Oceanobacillus halotolerans TaxID=2663380 RepID=UPI0013D913D0|nr:orotidine-5'-phosphate decarboxylase [Oceanobacillus halotolerans]